LKSKHKCRVNFINLKTNTMFYVTNMKRLEFNMKEFINKIHNTVNKIMILK